MKNTLVICLVILCLPMWLQAQVDNLARNTKISEELESQYKKDLEEAPNSAVPHWKYANALGKVSFRASDLAWKYYDLALSVDSTNAEIYFDYAKYMADKKQYTAALNLFDLALQFKPEYAAAKSEKESVANIVKKEDEYWKLKAMPSTVKDFRRPVEDYKKLIDYKKLFKQTADKKGKYYYPKLLGMYLENPDFLSDMEMYMLMLGRTQQADFKPYNYKEEIALQDLTHEDKIAEATALGEKLLQEDPLNLLVLRDLLFCYRKTGQAAKVSACEKRIVKIMDGILFSGNGSCDQPFMTISVQEEYIFVGYIGFSSTRNVVQETCNGPRTDKMKVVRKIDREEDFIHFNIDVLFSTMAKKL